MAKNIVIFQENEDSISNSIFGFKIMDQKLTDKFLNLVKKLANKNAVYDFGQGVSYYDIEKFEVIKLSSVDIRVLEKLFDIQDGTSESSIVGIFPDAFNDAYEIGLIGDIDDEDDEEYYE